MPKSKYKRRADGRKEGTIRIDGKRIHVYGYTDEEIERQKEELIRAAHDGSLYIDKETTFEVWSKKWLELIRPNRSVNTMKMYDRSVGQLNGLIGRYPLSGLRTSDLQIALNKYAGEPRTQQILYITLSQVYDKALAEQMILKNPCVNLEKIRYKAPEKRPLSPLEKEAFESADLSDSDRLFLSLLYYCGLRRGEALALSRGQFDLKKWTVKVDAALVFETDSRSVRKPMPKTEAGFRVLPLPNAIHSLIEYYFAEHTG
ncbi:MAG: tyrosine-type recombinase/integrase, partial [bacterium]